QIRDALLARRQRRPARFDNRRPEGWLAPSVQSRVDNVFTWSNRLYRWTPLCAVSLELVKFDMQKMQNLEISGVEYQQGELDGYNVRLLHPSTPI
ncbi:MAG: RRXRR domain-containing protein, partial [Anaerolineae bacterium]